MTGPGVEYRTSPRFNPDNISINFGSGGDSRLYYDGTDLIISPAVVGTGDLKVSGASVLLDSDERIDFGVGDVTLTHATGKLTFGGDGAVELDFANHEMTNVDIDSGAIDGTTIGSASAAAATVTTLEATGLITATGGQIGFPATQVASADANTLDDYEEGTWTPTLQDVSLSDSESQTYTTQIGAYTKIGNQVFVSGYVDPSDLTGLTAGDPIHIAGLPFTAASSPGLGHKSISIGQMLGAAVTAGYSVTGLISPGNSFVTLLLWDDAVGTSALLVSEFNTGSIFFSGVYEV